MFSGLGFEETFEDYNGFGIGSGSGNGARAGGEGFGVLLEFEEGFFGVSAGLGLDVGGERGGGRGKAVFCRGEFVRGI